MKAFNLSDIGLTKYLFFTGKGGVGKTSVACATAVSLADKGKNILLISTDPASNLQDVFAQELNGQGTPIADVPGLTRNRQQPNIGKVLFLHTGANYPKVLFRIWKNSYQGHARSK